jgi:superfamily II DNA or RNA helicase
MADVPTVAEPPKPQPQDEAEQVQYPKLKMQPLEHQQRVTNKLKSEDVPGQIAMHGLGTGKTFTAINSAQEGGRNLLAVTPASLRDNMRKEIEASGFSNPYKVVSYQEALNRAHDPEFQDFAHNSVMAVDEAHALGRAGSARSKLPGAINAGKKLFLTGTPIRNAPEEVAPLVNALEPGSLPEDPGEFRKKFTKTRKVPVGFWGWMKGVEPGKETVPTNLQDFEKAVKGKIDYHENVDRSDFPSFSEHVIETPMSHKQQSTYNFVMGKYPRLFYKIQHGIPLNKRETRNFQAFMSAPRQVANHPSPYNASATDEDAPKIKSIADEIQQRHEKDPNYRGVTYSSYLAAGAAPIARELERRGIPYRIFSGEQSEKERKQTIEDYNSGKVPHLIITKAGAEGLDLKGTKLMQITEPHWNEALINQARGRAIRYKSHSHLPENERHVEVQRFHSTPRKSWWETLTGQKRSKKMSADEYIYNLANQKRKMNEPFLRVLRGERAADVEKDIEKSAAVLGPCLRNSLAKVQEDPSHRLMMGPPGQPGDTAHFWTEDETGEVHEHTPAAVHPGYEYQGREVDPISVARQVGKVAIEKNASLALSDTGRMVDLEVSAMAAWLAEDAQKFAESIYEEVYYYGVA